LWRRSRSETIAIVVAFLLDVVWMIWLVVVAWIPAVLIGEGGGGVPMCGGGHGRERGSRT
jgi:hypothetical protein